MNFNSSIFSILQSFNHIEKLIIDFSYICLGWVIRILDAILMNLAITNLTVEVLGV